MTRLDRKSVLEENAVRLAELRRPRNPWSGETSVLPREKVVLSDLESPLFLPLDSLNDPIINEVCEAGSFTDFASKYGMSLEMAKVAFSRVRFNYDAEFWFASCTKIQHKTELTSIDFVLRIAQQILLEALEDMRVRGVPIRIVLVKARQWGGSTLVQMYMFWIQQIHKKNWHLAVCAQDDGAAGNIAELYKRSSREYPKIFGTVTYKPYARSPKNIENIERGGIIGVGSVNNPDQFRSYNYPMIHMSEPGVWKDTPARSAAQLVASLRSGVPKVPMSMIVMESTAKGMGTFFHKEWIAAESGKSAYKGVFVPWLKIDMYTKEIDDIYAFVDWMIDDNKELADAVDREYARFCWTEGATLEGINWYFDYRKSERYDEWMMHNEFPTTADEAFIASGQRYFSQEILIPQKVHIIDPKYHANVEPPRPQNREDLKRSTLVKAVHSNLEIYSDPKNIVTLKGIPYYIKNRYCLAGDVGGTSKEADYSSIGVFDRYRTLFQGPVSLAAEWHGHIDQDLLAWLGAQLGAIYFNGLFGLEVNSLKKEKHGNHFLTVLDNIKDYYDNLYIRNQLDSTEKDWLPKYGFHTNASSKHMILSNLRAGLRDGTYKEVNSEGLKELGFYEIKDDGELGAIDGEHDDRVMMRAIGFWMATSPTVMDPVQLVPVDDIERRKHRKGNNNPMGII